MKSGRGHIYPFRAFNDENPLTKNPPTWRFLGSRKNALPDSFLGFFQGHLRWNKHFSCDFWKWFHGSSFDRWIGGPIGFGKQ